MSKYKILFQLTGSIACFKACALISRLVREGCEVKAACTPSALRFIGQSTLEGLTGRPLYCDMFEAKQSVEHIALSKWADLSIICPATANIMGKMASGIGDDCVSTLFLAHDFSKPCLVAPAMNRNMWKHPATRRSVELLEEYGVEVLPVAEGRQACGDEGEGRMLEPDDIYAYIMAALDGRA
ncbi:MAG: flavoprotein [Elusimicrobia bacterium]|nr:flavoprotein [Elusimicrobiota bacterium]